MDELLAASLGARIELAQFRSRRAREFLTQFPPMDPSDKNEETRVLGCQSNVWVVAAVKQTAHGPVIEFSADSDAAITKGLVSILWRVFSGESPDRVLSFDIDSFIERLGLSAHLSMQRRNGLSGMVKRVKTLAAAAGGEFK